VPPLALLRRRWVLKPRPAATREPLFRFCFTGREPSARAPEFVLVRGRCRASASQCASCAERHTRCAAMPAAHAYRFFALLMLSRRAATPRWAALSLRELRWLSRAVQWVSGAAENLNLSKVKRS
jgi:hypothetical protein